MTTQTLSVEHRKAILALASDCERVDGLTFLNDDARFNLTSNRAQHHLAWHGDELAGYCQVDHHGHAVWAVAPRLRRRGWGRHLANLARESGAEGAWAFGTLPQARALAASSQALPARALLIMAKELDTTPAVTAPHDTDVRSFTDADADDVVALNRAAFAHHPEQGSLTREEFDERRAAEWFRPDGLLLAHRSQELVGFHWLKLHPGNVGEVYVLATAPAAQGSGIGKALLSQGLDWLARQGRTKAILYVESSEIIPIQLYIRAGFSEIRRDTYFEWKEPHRP